VTGSALNVADLDAAIEFYSKLFAADPAKIRPGYVNFAIADPPLKLVLIEHPDGRGRGTTGALNHLGVEVETSEQVQEAKGRLSGQGLDPEVREATTCCYAVQDKAWVDDPDTGHGTPPVTSTRVDTLMMTDTSTFVNGRLPWPERKLSSS
jgi:hypothetical protein